MKKFIVNLFVQTLAVLLVAYFMPGIIVTGLLPAVLAAVFLGLVNAVIRPVLILLTLPFTVVTLGVFILFVNGFCFWLTSEFVPGFKVEGVGASVFGALLVSVISWFLNFIFQPNIRIYRETMQEDGNVRKVKIVESKVRDVGGSS